MLVALSGPADPSGEAGGSGVDAGDAATASDAVDGEVLSHEAEASARVTPPLAAHEQGAQNLVQPGLARALPAPDAIQNDHHNHQPNPAQGLASCREPVAASRGPSSLARELPITGRLPSPALSSSPAFSLVVLPLASHRPLPAASSSLPPAPLTLLPPPSPAPPGPAHLEQDIPAAPMPKMVFSDLYKSPKSPFAKLRHLHSSSSSSQPSNVQHAEATPPGEPLDYGDPDLLSRDKAKQKEAVRRYLSDAVRDDWTFAWPPNDASPASLAAADARARTARHRLVLAEQVGLLEPTETFASPLSSAAESATVPLAAVSGAVAAAATAAASTGVVPSTDDVLDSDAESVYSTVSEDAVHFRPRAAWTSDVSDDDKAGIYYQRMPTYVHSPFRFDSPDTVGTAVPVPADVRKAKARHDLRAEMVWNDGLACFVARRDAWTGARTVHVKPAKPVVPAPPASPRRSVFRLHSYTKSEPVPVPVPSAQTGAAAAAAARKPGSHDSHSASTTPTAPSQTSPTVGAPTAMPLSPVTSNSRHSQHSQLSQQSHHSQQSQQSAGQETVATTPVTSDCGGGGDVDGAMLRQSVSPASGQSSPLRLTRSRAEYAVQTLLPVAPPLLPPGNPMRASITPNIYISLYDKLVTSSLQPSCPINLRDMIRSCVAGWKRDNEWPPRPMDLPTPTLSAMSVALRKKRRDDRREAQKDRRGSMTNATNAANAANATDAAPGSQVPPGLSRRMSNFLGGRPAPGGIVLPVTTAANADAGPTSPPVDEKDDDGMGGNRGIRRSLQRVLGLGYTAHGGHGHSHSVGTVGQATKPI